MNDFDVDAVTEGQQRDCPVTDREIWTTRADDQRMTDERNAVVVPTATHRYAEGDHVGVYVAWVLADHRQTTGADLAQDWTVDQSRIGADRGIELRIPNCDDLRAVRAQAVEHTQRRQVTEMSDEIADPQCVEGVGRQIGTVRQLAVGVGDQAHHVGLRVGHDRLLARWTMWTLDRTPSRSIVASVGPESDSGMVGLPGLTRSGRPMRLTCGTWLVPLNARSTSVPNSSAGSMFAGMSADIPINV